VEGWSSTSPRLAISTASSVNWASPASAEIENLAALADLP
jgi:hypothetical protein